MSQGNGDTQTDIDKTFDRLRREPFEVVMDETARCLGYEDRQTVIDVWAINRLGRLDDAWMEHYESIGWPWEELVAEARKRKTQEQTT